MNCLIILVLFFLGCQGQRANDKLLSTLSEILNGPLQEKWILALIDRSVFDYINEDFVLLFRNFPLYLIFTDDSSDSLDLLQSPILQNKNIVVLFFVGKHPKWFNNEDLSWGFNTVLIFNVNPLFNSKNILKSELIQRSENIALIEPRESESNETYIEIFTSKPFSRNDQGHRQFKLLLGVWNHTVFQNSKDLFPDRFPTFNGEILQVSSDSDDFPFVAIDENKNFYGLSVTLLKTLGSVLNFTFTTTFEAEDYNWGEKVNGTWNGLLKELITRDKNLAINYFTITYERSKDFDFSIPYFYEGFGFALRMPLPLPLWMNLTHPLSMEVWIGILISLLIFPLIFFYLSKFSMNPNYKPDLQEAYFDTLKSLLKQGIRMDSLKTKAAEKLCWLFWWYGAIIISVSYTGNLVAVLTIPAFPAKISSLSGLADSDTAVSMVDYGEFVPHALKTSKDSVLRKLGQKMRLIPWVDEDEEEAYRRMISDHLLSGEAAAIETYSYLLQLIRDDEKAGPVSYFLHDQIYSGPLVFYFPKHSPWHRRFDGMISSLVESGLITKWYEDLMQSEVQAESSSTDNLRSLTMHHLQGPFLILILGLGLAIAVFLTEFYSINCCANKQNEDKVTTE